MRIPEVINSPTLCTGAFVNILVVDDQKYGSFVVERRSSFHVWGCWSARRIRELKRSPCGTRSWECYSPRLLCKRIYLADMILWAGGCRRTFANLRLILRIKPYLTLWWCGGKRSVLLVSKAKFIVLTSLCICSIIDCPWLTRMILFADSLFQQFWKNEENDWPVRKKWRINTDFPNLGIIIVLALPTFHRYWKMSLWLYHLLWPAMTASRRAHPVFNYLAFNRPITLNFYILIHPLTIMCFFSDYAESLLWLGISLVVTILYVKIKQRFSIFTNEIISYCISNWSDAILGFTVCRKFHGSLKKKTPSSNKK